MDTWDKKAAANTKLSEEDVRHVRFEVEVLGKPRSVVADELGVAPSTIDKIIQRRTFRWIGDDPSEASRMPMNASTAERQAAQQRHQEAADRSLAKVQELLKQRGVAK